ncbi:MAG: response regulator transcription factor [Saccharopolyspora sp.]|uniref:response regulator transcription factor n=1 Tax=Saccharopolyspora sp. TaxID=33915 RepID=UPI0025E1B3B1|nr:response regulator transcription factor [Saccharopolyspora sp.]MBQ6644748.1 response regulator transcription factor [Saccharopolyspora sp.]
MSCELLLLTGEKDCLSVLPSLPLLPHEVRLLPPDPGAVLSASQHRAVLVDARGDLAAARELCRVLAGGDVPVVAVVNEGGLVTITTGWGVDEILLPTAGPAEVDARLRLLTARRSPSAEEESLTLGDLCIEEDTCTARLKGRALELTYKEFELLKYLAQHAGRVFTRTQLLREVWGYDFFGGTRTIDVHIRRLRAKLGPEHESMIGTVRNVGYKFVRPSSTSSRASKTLLADDAQAQAAEAVEAAATNEVATSRNRGSHADLARPRDRRFPPART